MRITHDAGTAVTGEAGGGSRRWGPRRPAHGRPAHGALRRLGLLAVAGTTTVALTVTPTTSAEASAELPAPTCGILALGTVVPPAAIDTVGAWPDSQLTAVTFPGDTNPTWFAAKGDPTVRGQRSVATHGPLDAPFGTPARPPVQADIAGVPAEFAYAAVQAVTRVDDKLVGTVWLERWPHGDSGRQYGSLGLALSFDGGGSWFFLGEILRAARPFVDDATTRAGGLLGQARLVDLRDGYLHVFFTDEYVDHTGAVRYTTLGVARSPRHLIAAGGPGSWEKYARDGRGGAVWANVRDAHGNWLHIAAYELERFKPGTVDVTSTVVYDEAAGRLLLATGTSAPANGGNYYTDMEIAYAYRSDIFNWSRRLTVVDVGNTASSSSAVLYASLIGQDPAQPDRVSSTDFHLYFNLFTTNPPSVHGSRSVQRATMTCRYPG